MGVGRETDFGETDPHPAPSRTRLLPSSAIHKLPKSETSEFGADLPLSGGGKEGDAHCSLLHDQCCLFQPKLDGSVFGHSLRLTEIGYTRFGLERAQIPAPSPSTQ